MVRSAQAERVLPELGELYEVLDRFGAEADTHVLARVSHDGIEFPIHGVVVGARRADAPTLALIGGVHGLERIGTRVVLAGMHTFAQYLTWDRSLANTLREVRLVFVPLVNPVGMWLRRRSNGRGVDLMRNAPPHPDAAATVEAAAFLPLTLELGSWSTCWVASIRSARTDCAGPCVGICR